MEGIRDGEEGRSEERERRKGDRRGEGREGAGSLTWNNFSEVNFRFKAKVYRQSRIPTSDIAFKQRQERNEMATI